MKILKLFALLLFAAVLSCGDSPQKEKEEQPVVKKSKNIEPEERARIEKKIESLRDSSKALMLSLKKYESEAMSKCPPIDTSSNSDHVDFSCIASAKDRNDPFRKSINAKINYVQDSITLLRKRLGSKPPPRKKQ
jgi:hypothetical protein